MSILTVPEGTYKLHNDVFITTLDENTTDLETQRTLRLHFYKKNKFNKKLATLNGYNLSKKNIQYNIAREDNLIMQAIDYHDILSKNMVSSNNCLKEVWNNYFPEMKCNAAMILLLGDLSDLKLRIGEIRSGSVWNEIPSDIVEMVKEELKKEESINNNDSKNDKNKTDNSKTDKSKINNSKIDTSKSDNSKIDMRKIDNASFLDGIVELYENTIGIKMLDSDFHNLKTQAINILRTSTQCTNLKTYIESKIRTLCPNLFYLIDPLLCARLIVKAGGFSNLAKLPASTIQILGAEKALFRALKSKTNTPKHGILYGMQNVRSMANKIAIAARIDYFGNTDGEYGKRLKEGRTYDICKEVYQEIEKKKQEKEKNEKKQNEKKEIENDGKTGEKSENVKSKKSEKSKKDKSDKKKARKSDDTVKSADDTAKSADDTAKSVDETPKSVDESKKFTIDVASNLEKEISKKVKKDIDSTVKLDDKNLSSFDDSMHEKGTKQNNDFLGENKNDPMVVKKKSTKKEKQKKEDKKGGKKEESKTKKNEKNDKDVVNDKSIVSEKSVAKSEKSIAKNEKKKDVSKTEKKDKKKDSQTEKKKESKKDDEKSVVSEKSVAKSDKKKDKKKESKKDDDKSVVSESKEKTKRKAAVPIPEKKVKKTKEKKEIEGEKEKKKSNKK